MLLGVLVIGIAQNAFAEESLETYIALDVESFSQPESKYSYQEITIFGHVEEYFRGDSISVTIVYPDETEEIINTYASKEGDIYTILHITHESQIGTHMVFLDYDAEMAFTTFEILENQ